MLLLMTLKAILESFNIFDGQTAFLDLEACARERLAVDRFLGQISDPQLSFSVRQ